MRKALLLFVLFAACVAASYPQAHAEPAGQGNQTPPPGTLPAASPGSVLPDMAATAPDKAQQAVPGTVPTSDLPAACPGNQAPPDTARTTPYKIVPDTVSLCYVPRDTVWNDALTMLNIIHLYHPDMFRVNPAEVFDKRIYELEHSLPDSLTAYQAYSCIAPVVAMVGDGHTNLIIPQESYYAHNPYWLPALPYIDKKDLKLKLAEAPFEYSEIVSINGKRNRDMVDRLLSYSGLETIPGRVAAVNHNMLYLFPLVDSSSLFSVEYVGKDGVLHTAKLEGVRIKEYQCRVGGRDDNLNTVSEDSGNPPIKFARVDPATVVFSLSSFDAEKAPPVIDSMFSYIKSEPKVKNLVIDLRGNLGGMASVITQLLKYLSPGEFYNYDDGVLSDSGKIWMPKLVAPYPAKKRFSGDLYVLIDNLSGSSSVVFSHLVQQGGFGTLVGEQTGGAVFMHGAPVTAKLSWGMKMQCSVCILWLPDLDHYRRTMEPVYPDVEVPSAEALDKVLEIIASGGGKRSRKGK